MARKWWSDKLLWLFALLWLCTSSCQSLRPLHDVGQLHDGDLLFHVVEQGNAITAVTHGTSALAIDHVAIYYTDSDGAPRAIQAVYDGVTTTPLDSLLAEPGYYVSGRVRGVWTEGTVARALQYVGKPYDFTYSEGDREIYCSELVLLSYVDREGHSLFAPVPMTFRDERGAIPPYWQSFYGQRNLSVPEGKPGSNPGELSRREGVKLRYYMPLGKAKE